MEKVSFKNSRGLNLAGHLFLTGSSKMVIMTHGFASDKASHGKTEKMAAALNADGYDILAFDFGGCGESDNDIITVENEVNDLQAAIEFAGAGRYRRIALYGHSLGSLICLKTYGPIIETMVLTGALTGPIMYDWETYYTAQQLQELSDLGYLTDKSDSQWRQKVKIGKQTLLEFERIDQKELLGKIRCPVLIIHGNSANDEEERLLLENSRRGLSYLPDGSRLEIIDGAGHRLIENFDKVIELVRKWYERHF